MSEPSTFSLSLGGVLLAVAAALVVAAMIATASVLRNRSAGRGTPQYARARDARRTAAYLVVLALVLAALATLTPLGAVRIG